VLTGQLLRQQSVSTQKSELEDLEARLRETEARLKVRQASREGSSSPLPVVGDLTDRRNNGGRVRRGVEGVFDAPENTTTGCSDIGEQNQDIDVDHTSMKQKDTSRPSSRATDHPPLNIPQTQRQGGDDPPSPLTAENTPSNVFKSKTPRPKSSASRS
jgi:hypothetical protein